MTQSPVRADVPPDALALLDEKGSAERALTAALASFQEQVQAVPSLDLAAVVKAARPAFAAGIAFSDQLVDIHGRHKLRVTVMHASGAQVCSEEWADAVDDPLETCGWMLAMLLGIPLQTQAMPVKPEEAASKSLASHGGGDNPSQAPSDALDDAALLPLSEQEIADCHQRILELPQAARQALTKAFREHFEVPRNARSIGDRITQQRHAAFIEHVLAEAANP